MKREEIADMLKRILAEIVEAAEKSDDGRKDIKKWDGEKHILG